MEKKTHWKKEFNYDYMGSYSLPDGGDITLTIKSTTKQQVTGMNGKKEDCFVCYFKEADKPMILNRTNCKTISKLSGSPFIENWPGVRVVVGIDKVSAFGEMVEALRIRNIKPRSTVNYSKQAASLRACTTIEQLQGEYLSLSRDEQAGTVSVKDEMKSKLTLTQQQ